MRAQDNPIDDLNLQVFTLFDVKANVYRWPFPALNAAVAGRMLEGLLTKDGNEVSNHPEDFTLFKIGTYSQRTGKFAQDPVHFPLGSALEYKSGRIAGGKPRNESNQPTPISANRKATASKKPTIKALQT